MGQSTRSGHRHKGLCRRKRGEADHTRASLCGLGKFGFSAGASDKRPIVERGPIAAREPAPPHYSHAKSHEHSVPCTDAPAESTEQRRPSVDWPHRAGFLSLSLSPRSTNPSEPRSDTPCTLQLLSLSLQMLSLSRRASLCLCFSVSVSLSPISTKAPYDWTLRMVPSTVVPATSSSRGFFDARGGFRLGAGASSAAAASTGAAGGSAGAAASASHMERAATREAVRRVGVQSAGGGVGSSSAAEPAQRPRRSARGSMSSRRGRSEGC